MIIISFLCIIWMYVLVKKQKLSTLLYAMFLVSPAIVVFRIPIEMPFKRWIVFSLIIFFILQQTKNRNYNIPKLDYKFPMFQAVLFMFLASIILIFPDERFGLLYRILYPILDAMDIYLPLFLGYYFIVKGKHLIGNMYRPILICCLIAVSYGIFNFVTNSNPIVSFISNLYHAGESVFEKLSSMGDIGRKGVFSLYRYTFDFGFNSGLFLLVLGYFLFTFRKITKLHYIAIALSFIGLFLSASRTVIVSGIGAFLILFILSKDQDNRKIKIVFSGIVLILSAYLLVPPVSNMVDITIETIFLQTNEVQGSSISMREGQLLGSISLWSQAPILGNGFKYIFLDLGWKDGTMIDDMAGYESLAYSLLIERGIVGIAAYLFFFISLFAYYWKQRVVNKGLSALGISVLFLFLTFALGTGALDAWHNTMLCSGFIIAFIELEKKKLCNNKKT